MSDKKKEPGKMLKMLEGSNAPKTGGRYGMRGEQGEDSIPSAKMRAAVRQELGEVYERLESVEASFNDRLDRLEMLIQTALLENPSAFRRVKKKSIRQGVKTLTDADIKVGHSYITELHHPRGKRAVKAMIVSSEIMKSGDKGYIAIRLTGSERTMHRKLQARPAAAFYEVPEGWEPDAATDEEGEGEE